MRREEALADLQPEAKQKQGKGKKKLSLAFKGFLKNKACNKNRPSAKHKAQKKGAQKTASTKALVKAGSKQHLPEDHHCLHLSKHHLLILTLMILFSTQAGGCGCLRSSRQAELWQTRQDHSWQHLRYAHLCH